jgi:uncharacterized protein (TIGR02391 family)
LEWKKIKEIEKMEDAGTERKSKDFKEEKQESKDDFERFQVLFNKFLIEFEIIPRTDNSPQIPKERLLISYRIKMMQQINELCRLGYKLVLQIPKKSSVDFEDFREGLNVLMSANLEERSLQEWQLENKYKGIAGTLQILHIRYTPRLEAIFDKRKTELINSSTSHKSLDYFDLIQIHPEIRQVSEKLYKDGSYAESIRAAYIQLTHMVKQKSGRNDLDGKPLMLTVFSVNDPVLKFNELKTQEERDEQEGFMHLYAGASQGIRNPKAHTNTIQKDPIRTLEYLTFASFLCKRLEDTKKAKECL